MYKIRTATQGGEARVKSHQLHMAFWTHTLRRDPETLLRLYFESVLEEETTQVLRQQICPRLRKNCIDGVHAPPWETIDVYRPHSSHRDSEDFATGDELIMWGSLVGEMGPGSRLVKIALHMCDAYPRRDEYTGVVQVERVIFRPKIEYKSMPRLVGYDLEICVGLEESLAHRPMRTTSPDYTGAGETLASTSYL